MNKQDILKMAGVKDEKSLYKLFPNEQSFIAKHGKTLNKLMRGDSIQKAFPGKKIPYNYNYNPNSTSFYVNPSEGDNIDQPQSGINYQFGQQSNVPGQLGYNLSRDPYKPMYNVGGGEGGMQQLGTPSSQQLASNVPTDFNLSGKGNSLGNLAPFADVPGKIVGGLQKLKAEKQQKYAAQQWNNVSDIQLQASQTEDIDTSRQLSDNMTKRRQMMMPVNTGEEFFPIYGTGTNPLAKDGKKIKGKKAWNGAMTSMVGQNLDKVTGALYGDNAGSDLGGTLGKTAGQLFGGPVGGMVGEQLGKFAGWALDSNPRKIEKANDETFRNANMIAFNNMQHSNAYMRAGGNLKDYTPPSENALQTFDMGGDLQTHWGGYAEPISQNPYLPEDGQTVMFRGNSHDESDGKGRTGIGMTFGNSPVEVEKGEPAVKLSDGGQDNSLVVFGNLPIHNNMLPLLGDPDAKGKKFKNYISDLSKKEQIQNKTIDKTTKQLEDFTPRTPFDKLTLASYTANMKGADMKLKDIAGKKQNAAALQQAINDTAEEHNLISEDLAKGNIKYAKKGISIPKAETGIIDPPYKVLSPEDLKRSFDNQQYQYNPVQNPFVSRYATDPFNTEQPIGLGRVNALDTSQQFVPITPTHITPSPMSKKDVVAKQKQISKDVSQSKGMTLADMIKNRPTSMNLQASSPTLNHYDPTGVAALDSRQMSYSNPNSDVYPETTQIPNWMNMVNSLIPYLRPSDAEQLDPRQLSGEMFALSNNQQEPIQMQTFQPQLSVPYDISLQDQLNENQATIRGTQRMMPYNQSAQANLAAQQYGANERVLGEQFRMNQGMKNQTYAQNRQALDNAQLRNLQIYDQQSTRQSQAKSNTKELAQTALSSIADKFMKNKLENRTLQTYENMYNYRYDNRMRTQNMNPLAQFNTEGFNANYHPIEPGKEQLYNAKDEIAALRHVPKKKSTSRNGSIVSAYKNL